METITVTAARGFALSEMQLLVVGALVIAVVTWMVLSRVKHFRSRQEPRV